jgi:hypothetical protein
VKPAKTVLKSSPLRRIADPSGRSGRGPMLLTRI